MKDLLYITGEQLESIGDLFRSLSHIFTVTDSKDPNYWTEEEIDDALSISEERLKLARVGVREKDLPKYKRAELNR